MTAPQGNPRNVCVYCASSQQAHPDFYTAAADLGRILAAARITTTYGGGAVGLMGSLASAALDGGGRVVGILPRFMDELEWGHPALTELLIVPDMHDRKRRMVRDADAIVALPGGCGTLEELLEAITWKRLGLHDKPIVLLNTRDFYRPLIEMLDRTIDERFMRPEHARMWVVVDDVEDVLPSIRSAPPWDKSSRAIATW